MRIGLQPPTSGPLATTSFVTEVAELADALGYESLHVTDHVVVPADVKSRYPYNAAGVLPAGPDDPYFEPISLLSYLAGCTKHIRLGTSVLVLPYRNPVLVAKQFACIDSLSGGRCFLGVGTGWMEEEFRILGAPPHAERGAITDEYIEVLRTIWREPRPEFAGRYSSFPPLGANPKPVQPAGIPIFVGGNTRPAIRRAARLVDGWMPLKLAPDSLTSGLQYLRQKAREYGRDPSRLELSLRLGLRMVKGTTERRPGEEDLYTMLVGSARDLMGTLRTYQDLGVTEIAFDFRTCRTADEIRETVELCGQHLVHAEGPTTRPGGNSVFRIRP